MLFPRHATIQTRSNNPLLQKALPKPIYPLEARLSRCFRSPQQTPVRIRWRKRHIPPCDTAPFTMAPVPEDAKTVAKIHPRPRSVHLRHTPSRMEAIQIRPYACPASSRTQLTFPETAASAGCTWAQSRFFARLVQVARGTGQGLHFRAHLRDIGYRSRQFAAFPGGRANTNGPCLRPYFHCRIYGLQP